MASYTRQVADFAANLKLDTVPQEVIARAKGIILDGLGCGLYASDVKWTQILAGVIQRLEPRGGQASIWGRRETASAVNAALVNGTMVQGYELDDAHPSGWLHSAAIVLPAAFAAAEVVGADKVSGEQLLLAIIAGFEVGPRVGMCMRGEQMTLNGWHSGAIVAPFPAAVSAGVVLGLNSDQFLHALGIAGTQASGLMAAQYGSMVKRMQHGKGAQSGLYGALLAADGFTGIENVFEVPFGGYCSTFTHSSDQFDLPELVAGLGKHWETMRVTIKIYACRGGIHSALDAVDELVHETGLKAEDIEEITLGLIEASTRETWSPYVPKGLTAAQMHPGFCIAMRLIEGDVFIEQMVEENIARADLIELANRVEVVRNAEREQKGDDYLNGCDMVVKLKSGSVLNKTVDFYRGSEHRPLTAAEMAAKYRRLAVKALPQDQVAEIEKLVWALDSAPTVSPLISALRAK